MASERRESSSYSSSSGRLERVFCHCDENGDGKVSPLELYSRMNNIGIDFSMEEAIEAVRSADIDGDGFLGFDEFSELIPEEEQDEEVREKELRQAFGVYEMERSGFITASSLKSALEMMGKQMEMADCKEMIRRYDLDGDDVISFDEFKTMMID